MSKWHALSEKEVLRELGTSEHGISEKEASARLEKYGKNEIREVEKISPLMIFLQQFKSVFIVILLFAAAFSLIVRHYIDFGVISVIILLNSFIGFFQQYKAEKTIFELKKMLVPKAKVIREGKLSEIPSTELVPGDVVVLSEGDKIMADCRMIYAEALQTNEAVLTGESFPIDKHSHVIHAETELPERGNMLYMGTSVVRGHARAIVAATNMQTEFGKIAGLVQKVKIKKTPLEEKLDAFSRKVAVAIVVLALITIGVGLLRGEDKFNMILTGISLAVSVIPEGLPAVIALTLAFAIGRMKKHNSLVRKLPAGETLGRTTVICADKTGTMTTEEMSVTDLYCNNKNYSVKNRLFFLGKKKISADRDNDLMQLLKIGIMCNNARKEEGEGKIFGDPTEKALLIAADKAGIVKKEETEKEIRVKEYPFTSTRKMMSIVREEKHGILTSYAKGAPDVILKNCSQEFVNGRIVHLTSKRCEEIKLTYEKMASGALRVLGFAFKKLPRKFKEDDAESGLVFAGFQGMLDLPREEVKPAVEECRTAGIKVKMLTGDSLLTALAVSGMIGLEKNGIEGKELEKLPEKEFSDIVREKTVFARITPEIKLRIIQSLKKQGEIVAVTGDGVNDVLALKEADIGVAMGIRGTDVAREVSDIVLLDDNFSSIVKAVSEGRRVYDNMKKSIKFHLAANIEEIFVVLAALVLAWPLPLMPLAILWMNLITDSLPSLALTVEPAEKDIMRRNPVNPKEKILDNITGFVLIAGIIAFIITFGLFAIFYEGDLVKARTLALTSSVFLELFLVFTCRSDKSLLEIGIFSNKFLLYSVIGAFVLQILAIYSPLSAIFGFKALSFGELGMVIGLSSLGLVFFEVKKLVQGKNHKL
jgi:Ca2+-transporting ATPase